MTLGVTIGGLASLAFTLLSVWNGPVIVFEQSKPALVCELGAVIFGLIGMFTLILPELARDNWRVFRREEEVAV